MNLYEQLMKADPEKAKEYAKSTYKSKRLGKVLGTDKPVEITIHEVSIETIKNIQQYSTRRDGTLDTTKSFDTNLMLVVKGVTIPSDDGEKTLDDKELQSAFGASSAMQLAEILFRFESAFIADAILKLSNMNRSDIDDTIKN